MTKITIAIDGLSSTGKSTIAKQLANELGYAYVDTGAMYRAVTLFAMQSGFFKGDKLNTKILLKVLPNIQLKFVPNQKLGFAEMFLNGENVEQQIRTMEVSEKVSTIATVSEVRQFLVSQQQKMGKDGGVVMDGRDIGTVVFPDAELKLYLTASDTKRATRRYRELLERGDDVTYEAVLKNVQHRDFIDSTRDDSPLTKAEDAIAIDNSDMGLKEQSERILSLAHHIIDKASH